MIENLEKALEKELRRDTHKTSIIEQVDDFIEGVAEGSILFITAKIQTISVGVLNRDMGFSSEKIKRFGDMRRELIEDLIPMYKQFKGKDKRTVAFEIYRKILWGRSIGLIYNDPNSLKELNWYRIQNESLTKENEKLRTYVKDLVKDLSNNIMKNLQ